MCFQASVCRGVSACVTVCVHVSVGRCVCSLCMLLGICGFWCMPVGLPNIGQWVFVYGVCLTVFVSWFLYGVLEVLDAFAETTSIERDRQTAREKESYRQRQTDIKKTDRNTDRPTYNKRPNRVKVRVRV